MNYLDIIKKREEAASSPYAVSSFIKEERQSAFKPCVLRTQFARDRDRIIHSKAFRRLKHKTQVFISPQGDHYRTRLTHTFEVSGIARGISRALGLNEDLAEAIALGHDLGHTPFGHCGEGVLYELTDGYFQHNMQSLRVVDILENNFKGLNLTNLVRDGILNHRSGTNPQTLEGHVVLLSDKIAYINHDIDDCVRAGALKESQLPKEAIKLLGKTHGERINSMVFDIVENSYNKNYVKPTDECKAATNILRDFMFEHIYKNPPAKEDEAKAKHIVKALYQYFYYSVDKLPSGYKKLLDNMEKHIVICDYISGFTDEYAIEFYKELFIPSRFNM